MPQIYQFWALKHPKQCISNICLHLQPPVPTVESDEANDRLDRFFEKLAGQDLQIDAWELQKILSYALKKG